MSESTNPFQISICRNDQMGCFELELRVGNLIGKKEAEAFADILLSFGWQSAGMGVGRGYELIETMLVAHGGGHNDTICIAERKSCSVTSTDRCEDK